jgi:hypothetical protein
MRTSLLAAATVLLLATTPALAEDKDCVDFATHAQAQAYFEAHPGDPDYLDGDGDGIACELLPGAPPDARGYHTDGGDHTDGGGHGAAYFGVVLLVAGAYALGKATRKA